MSKNTQKLNPNPIDVVFADDFWHAKLLKKETLPRRDALEAEVEQILRRLRIYSLFFETIYVSRLHFIHFSDQNQRDVVDLVVNSDLFQVFVKTGVLRLSIRKGLDGQSDNERLIERSVAAGGEPNEDYLLSALPTIRDAQVHEINSDAWSGNTEEQIKGFLNLLTRSGHIPNSDTAKRIIAGSYDSSGRFLFELFYFSVVQYVDDPHLRSHIVSEAGEIYLSLPESQHWDFVTPETVPRHLGDLNFDVSSGIDRWLLSPPALQTFLEMFWKEDELERFFRLSGEQLLALRGEAQRGSGRAQKQSWDTFRREYQAIADALSKSLRIKNNLAKSKDHPIRVDYEKLFNEVGKVRVLRSLDSALVSAAETYTEVDPAIGGTASLLVRTTRSWLTAQLRIIQWSIRHPKIFFFLQEARNRHLLSG